MIYQRVYMAGNRKEAEKIIIDMVEAILPGGGNRQLFYPSVSCICGYKRKDWKQYFLFQLILSCAVPFLYLIAGKFSGGF